MEDVKRSDNRKKSLDIRPEEFYWMVSTADGSSKIYVHGMLITFNVSAHIAPDASSGIKYIELYFPNLGTYNLTTQKSFCTPSSYACSTSLPTVLGGSLLEIATLTVP